MSKHRRKTEICPNCHTILRPEDNFCPNCGQENHDLKVPIGHLAYEFVESITHFDTKLWNTLKAIFTRPGKLTKDFLEGKRASYVPPARLYIFVSVIFFLLITKVIDKSIDKAGLTKKDNQSLVELNIRDFLSRDEITKNNLESVGGVEFEVNLDSVSLKRDMEKYKKMNDNQIDSLLKMDETETNPLNRQKIRKVFQIISEKDSIKLPVSITIGTTKLNFGNKRELDKFKENIKSLSDKELDSTLIANKTSPNWFSRTIFRKFSEIDFYDKKDIKILIHACMKSISFTMFLLMPVVAILLLWIFYRKKYYYEHLIFSIHIHTFYFLIFSIIFVIGIIFGESVMNLLLGFSTLLMFVYLMMSLKYVYGKSWFSTFLRFCLMSIPYFILASFFFSLAMFYGFLLS